MANSRSKILKRRASNGVIDSPSSALHMLSSMQHVRRQSASHYHLAHWLSWHGKFWLCLTKSSREKKTHHPVDVSSVHTHSLSGSIFQRCLISLTSTTAQRQDRRKVFDVDRHDSYRRRDPNVRHVVLAHRNFPEVHLPLPSRSRRHSRGLGQGRRSVLEGLRQGSRPLHEPREPRLPLSQTHGVLLVPQGNHTDTEELGRHHRRSGVVQE